MSGPAHKSRMDTVCYTLPQLASKAVFSHKEAQRAQILSCVSCASLRLNVTLRQRSLRSEKVRRKQNFVVASSRKSF